MTVAGIVLAAGAGRRYGGPKALARFQGQTLLARAITTIRNGGCAPVIVVLGAAAEEVIAASDLGDVTLVVNQEWESGLSSSLRSGLAAAGTSPAAAALVALVDQPLVTPASVARLVSAFESGATAAVATYDGQLRNPALFARSVWPAVAASAVGDSGARAWLQAHSTAVTRVECGDIAAADDIDTPHDHAWLAGWLA